MFAVRMSFANVCSIALRLCEYLYSTGLKMNVNVASLPEKMRGR